MVLLTPSVACAEPKDAPSVDLLRDSPLSFTLLGEGPSRPWVGLGFRAEFGPLLTGRTAVVYRATPILVLGVRVTPRVDLYGGGGAGPAYVSPAIGTDRILSGLTGTVGAEVDSSFGILHAELRADAVESFGTYVKIVIGLRLAPYP